MQKSICQNGTTAKSICQHESTVSDVLSLAYVLYTQILIRNVQLYYLTVCFKHYLCGAGKARSVSNEGNSVICWHSDLLKCNYKNAVLYPKTHIL